MFLGFDFVIAFVFLFGAVGGFRDGKHEPCAI
jgi:hypothetical protein